MTTITSRDGAPSGNRAAIDVLHGTDEYVWQRSGVLDDVQSFDLEEYKRVVVVAPHPDDEILALGATMARLSLSGAEVILFAVTDGEASHPGSTSVTPDELKKLRPAETASACGRLGIILHEVVRLAIPDGGANGAEASIADALVRLLDTTTVCFAPFRFDGHPDHEASGRAAATAAAKVGAQIVEFPVWAWNANRPGDGVIPFERARAIQLSEIERRAKSRAISAFCTQITRLGPAPEDGPVLPPSVLAHFSRSIEIVLVT